MSSEVKLSQEARRYLPMVHSIAATMQSQLQLKKDVSELIRTGSEGLEAAVRTFQRGHNTSFRIFAHYHIRLAIYLSLRENPWPSIEAANKYRFHEKADEILDWYSRSADSMMKRTLDAEITELKKLLRGLITSALLVSKQYTGILEALPEVERELLRLCFLQDFPLEEAARKLRLSKNRALRAQFQGLQNMSAAMRP